MPRTTSGAPSIYYETTGISAGQPLVLIEGLGAQLVGWRQGFVDKLVSRGFFVIRLDNRDVGLSDKLGGPDQLEADYTVSDMAGDVFRVLDELGVGCAHVAGQSMGGAIAQEMAIQQPERVRSLTLIYTAPAFDAAFLTDELKAGFGAAPAPPATSREEAIAAHVESERLCGSADYSFDEAWIRELAGVAYDRCYRPDGVLRQRAALLASTDRRAALATLTLPTAIIHGRADRLVKEEASIVMAELIASSELHLYPGMGHQVVEPLWDDFIAIISRTAARASAAGEASRH